jgi:hypothetical protein
MRKLTFVLGMSLVTWARAAPTDGQNFALSVEAPATAQVGKVARARVKLLPGQGYKINKGYPIKLEVTPPGGVDVERRTLRAADAVRLDAQQALFEVAFTAREPGRKEVKAVLGFSVCTAKACVVKKEPLAFSTDVR